MLRLNADKIVVAASVLGDEEDVRCNQQHIDLLTLKANHEEADTRFVLHCVESRSSTIVIAARDTDIIMLLLAHYHHFPEGQKVFVTMGNHMYLDIQFLSQKLGPQVCAGLLLAHALTGCDAVSFMYGIGKLTVVKVLLANPDLLSGITLSPQLSRQHRVRMERFVCLCYGHNELRTLDEVRAQMLFSCSKPEQLPMTTDAFGPHSNRGFYVGRMWECAIDSHPNLPSPTAPGAGWYDNEGQLAPITMTKESIPKAIKEIQSCACAKGCQTLRCRCFREGLKCTRLCHRKLPVGVCKNCLE